MDYGKQLRFMCWVTQCLNRRVNSATVDHRRASVQLLTRLDICRQSRRSRRYVYDMLYTTGIESHCSPCSLVIFPSQLPGAGSVDECPIWCCDRSFAVDVLRSSVFMDVPWLSSSSSVALSQFALRFPGRHRQWPRLLRHTLI